MGSDKASTHARHRAQRRAERQLCVIAAPFCSPLATKTLSDAILRPYVTTLAVLGLVMRCNGFRQM